jgi:phosphonopyruvate decarboxylase
VIEPDRFLDETRRRGLAFYSGVPCSYLGSLIDALPQRDYVVAANEGDAVATCAGAVLADRGAVAFMQNSGLGNAVNPLASLTWPFRLPVLLLVTLRGDPERGDEPQHRLMGSITGALLDSLEIPWQTLSSDPADLVPALERAGDSLKARRLPYALVVRGDTFAPRPAPGAAALERSPRPRARAARVVRHGRGRPRDAWPTRAEALEAIVAATPTDRSVVIGTTGYTSRELYALADRPNQFYMVGSMGCASALGLGIALARPDLRVVVVDGDGALLMRLGNLAAIGAHPLKNLCHVVLDNEVHESTGRQPTASAGVALAEIARACGYALALEGDGVDALDALFAAPDGDGPRFAHVKIRPGARSPLPRPSLSPEELRDRFAGHLRGRSRA